MNLKEDFITNVIDDMHTFLFIDRVDAQTKNDLIQISTLDFKNLFTKRGKEEIKKIIRDNPKLIIRMEKLSIFLLTKYKKELEGLIKTSIDLVLHDHHEDLVLRQSLTEELELIKIKKPFYKKFFSFKYSKTLLSLKEYSNADVIVIKDTSKLVNVSAFTLLLFANDFFKKIGEVNG